MVYFGGLDISMRNTGVVVLRETFSEEEDELHTIQDVRYTSDPLRVLSQTISVKNRETALEELISSMEEVCEKVMNLEGYTSIMWGMEGYSYGSKRALTQVAESVGVVKWLLSTYPSMGYMVFSPTEVKKWWGRGNLTKQEIRKIALERGIEGDEHQLDALALANLARDELLRR